MTGAGAWGTTLAMVAHRAGRQVLLLSRSADVVEHLRLRRQHPTSLAGVKIPNEIDVQELRFWIPHADDVVLLAIPVQQLRMAVGELPQSLNQTVIVNVGKGIEVVTMLSPLAILEQVIPDVDVSRLAVLSGPNLALEIARGQPATAVVASRSTETAERIQLELSSASFRIYTGSDTIGVEMGGALKNIIAIGAGIADGLGAGHNAKAAFLTRGIAEIARLGIACGAEPMTFAGLSGIGDLIATCGSTLSRNHTVGRGLAEGHALDEIVAMMSETAEGIETTRAALSLAEQLGVNVPIIRGMHSVLFEGASPVQAAADLMARDPTSESFM
ncbi:MAG: NAD(P)H-dependent glycerol-3-phosphate dehydrogenase [Thermomicrobiales bacterium]